MISIKTLVLSATIAMGVAGVAAAQSTTPVTKGELRDLRRDHRDVVRDKHETKVDVRDLRSDKRDLRQDVKAGDKPRRSAICAK